MGFLVGALIVSPALAQKISKGNVLRLTPPGCVLSPSTVDSAITEPRIFNGGSPGWQEAGRPPTVETEILVSEDGDSIIDVVYNGSPR